MEPANGFGDAGDGGREPLRRSWRLDSLLRQCFLGRSADCLFHHRAACAPFREGESQAFASLSSRAAVLEGFGLKGFGAHSNESEYIEISSIAPRLYLAARLIMDASQGKAGNTTN